MNNAVYIAIFALLFVGLFGTIVVVNRIKKLLFLNMAQSAVIMMFVAAGYKAGFVEPIYGASTIGYVNPVPHVLMLTAIVVGVAVSAVGLAMAIKIDRHEC